MPTRNSNLGHNFDLSLPSNHYHFLHSYRWNASGSVFDQLTENSILLRKRDFKPNMHRNPDTFAKDDRYRDLDNTKAFPYRIGVSGFYNNTPYFVGVSIAPDPIIGLATGRTFNRNAIYSSTINDSESKEQVSAHFFYVIKPHSNATFSSELVLYDGASAVSSKMAQYFSNATLRDLVDKTSFPCSNSNHYMIHDHSVLFGCVKRTGCFPTNKDGDVIYKTDENGFVKVEKVIYETGVKKLSRYMMNFCPRLDMNQTYIKFTKIQPSNIQLGKDMYDTDESGSSPAVESTTPNQVDISIDINFTLAFPVIEKQEENHSSV